MNLAPDLPGAACAGHAALMDPRHPTRTTTRDARTICATCPALQACAAWATTLTTDDDPGGTIAGTTATQRQKARRTAAATQRARARTTLRTLRTTKACTRCHQGLPLDAFAGDRTTADGLRYWCRTCSAAYNATRRRSLQETA